jgi:alanine-glyoxylate transaminase/serine-glyoxylate transaminase/serine-pyruvate transaminase
LGEVAGKVFRIGHLGSLTDTMVLSGLATMEMAMADLGIPGRRWAAGSQRRRNSTAPRAAPAS